MSLATPDDVEVVDCTGVTIGNHDLEDSCTWQPSQKEPERAPLPGHEHLIGVAPGWGA